MWFLSGMHKVEIFLSIQSNFEDSMTLLYNYKSLKFSHFSDNVFFAYSTFAAEPAFPYDLFYILFVIEWTSVHITGCVRIYT